jgi:hypothetical protein
MTPKEAFNTITDYLSSVERYTIIKQEYDEEMFGNFHISYRTDSEDASIVADRGQVFICKDLEAKKCTLVVEALYYEDKESLKKALLLT